ncbi:hypothetical protein ACWJJH_14190 [Endozoicomonadaceae bacterium StTr2]
MSKLVVSLQQAETVVASNRGAAFLVECLKWSQSTTASTPARKGWFYKSYSEWRRESGFSRTTIIKYTEQLIRSGVLSVFMEKTGNLKRNIKTWYRLNTTVLVELLKKTALVTTPAPELVSPAVLEFDFIGEQPPQPEPVNTRQETDVQPADRVAQLAPEAVAKQLPAPVEPAQPSCEVAVKEAEVVVDKGELLLSECLAEVSEHIGQELQDTCELKIQKSMSDWLVYHNEEGTKRSLPAWKKSAVAKYKKDADAGRLMDAERAAADRFKADMEAKEEAAARVAQQNAAAAAEAFNQSRETEKQLDKDALNRDIKSAMDDLVSNSTTESIGDLVNAFRKTAYFAMLTQHFFRGNEVAADNQCRTSIKKRLVAKQEAN